MYCERVELHDYHFPIEYQQEEIDQRIQLLQQWINNIEDLTDDEEDIYFDCVEQFEGDEDNVIEIPPTYEPWLSEIWLSVHRKTSLFRRFLNYFNRSKRLSLPNLAEEFVRINNGPFNHPIGFHFHISYAKEKWLLILKNIKVINHPMYPYPETRIIFIRKGILSIAR